MSQVDDLRRCIVRDLDTAIAEIEAFPDDSSVWSLPAGLPNSAGTLALHLAGNLRHFIGSVIGASGYVRDRAEEFSTRGLPREDLVGRLGRARDEVGSALGGLDPASLDRKFPIEIAGVSLSTGQVLTHLATHASYHLGQIDYCRRVVTGNSMSVGAMGLRELEARS